MLPSARDVDGARSSAGDRSGRPEELGLEAAAVAPVDADEVLDRPAVLEVGDAAEDEHGRARGHAELGGDLRVRAARLDRARASVELVAELALVGLEQRAVAYVEVEDRRTERVRHGTGGH